MSSIMRNGLSDPGLRSTILVLNSRFVPATRSEPHIYGVVQHAFRTADVLAARGVHTAFLLYERDERIDRPTLHYRSLFGIYPSVVVRFHFRMDHNALISAFRQAAAMVADGAALLYYQTSTLLPFAPPEYDTVVTHHSPFVADVAGALGAEGARRAFDWDHTKADHLATWQRAGLRVTRARHNLRCAEISPIQRRHLLRAGVPAERVHTIPQPLAVDTDHHPLPERLEQHLAEANGGVLALTAVSRLDYFKNVELFIRGACAALRHGDITSALVVGGSPDDPARDRLRRLVPAALQSSVVLEPRISHHALTATLFPRLSGQGVFVCSSRFDLVPYTALEAARTGLCTIVPDTDTVGAATYLPPQYRFPPTPAGLAGRLRTLAQRAPDTFDQTAKVIRDATSDTAFLEAFHHLSERTRSG